MWQLLGGIYLGWGIGANDSANIFGTAVSTRVIRWITAALIIGIFATIGALIQGAPTVVFVKNKLGEINTINQAFIASFSAALTIMILTILSIPSSTSQSTAGAIIGLTLAIGGEPQWGGLIKAVICWVATPIGAAIFSYLLYKISDNIIEKYVKNQKKLNMFIKWGTIISGAFAAYSLGANNCGNATGFFYFKNGIGHPGIWDKIFSSSQILATIGGLSIALGTLTYSKKVMETVGEGITKLNPLTSLIVVLAEGITVWIFAVVGVPVSTSQAVVGAVIGIGLVKGAKTVSFKKLVQIFIGWVCTPLSSGVISFIIIIALKKYGII